NPATPLSAAEEVLHEMDELLLMTVNPGFGGQKFIPSTLDKITRARALLDERGVKADLGIDGGVNAETIGRVARAGATMLVAGSAVYNPRESVADAVRRLRGAIEG
ncbi:MAG: ribulose-phosphate 3-epimerase, partial [SAR202 cluster bacterium]|nr:ribulose-phosphate 3-epimerase [SAR202 cluster bacterium]